MALNNNKKRNLCIYLIVYMNFYSFTDLSRGSASQEGARHVFLFLNAFSTDVAAKTKVYH